MPKDYPRRVSEKEIHLKAWQWVRDTYPDLLIFHVPNGEARDTVTALKLKRMGVLPGVSDFLMFIPGAAIAIELKEEGGKQSLAQIAFQKHWEKIGNRYRVARSLEEFQEIVKEFVWPWSHNLHPSP